jgi:DNA-binding SARP family transcriptional activator
LGEKLPVGIDGQGHPWDNETDPNGAPLKSPSLHGCRQMSVRRFHLYLLGPFRLHQDDQPVAGFDQARLQHLLGYLALHRQAPISRPQLAFSLWPDTTDQQALKNLRTLLARMRQALPGADDFISITTQTLEWRPNVSFTLDVAEFEAALAQAAVAQEYGEGVQTVRALEAAVAAYTGDLLPDCYDDWVLPLREQLRLAYGHALERLVLLLEEQRHDGEAIPYAQRLLRHDPLHEPAYRHLMRLHLALGNRAEARRVYLACDTMLRHEFGARPTRPTRALYERLLKEDAPPTGGRPPQARPADIPLVGRKAEWSLLLSAWRAASAGKAQIILLTGEAGIGKTRLAEELVAWVTRQGAAAAAARCYAGSRTLAYAAVAEWLNDPALRPRLAALNDVWLGEVARILPALLAEHQNLAPPGPLTEAWQRTRLFQALARAALGPIPGQSEPLLLFLDDLQWADWETLDWLVYLLHYEPGAPLLIVGAARKHEVTSEHPLTKFRLALAPSGLLREIALWPLDAAETALLAATVAGREVKAAEAEHLYQGTEGNPLFVVEMVRAGMAHEDARRQESKQIGQQAQPNGQTDPGQSDLAPLAAAPALPPTVRAVIQRRLALLSPTAQALVQTAAVIGRQFNFDVLAQASGQDEAAVVEGMEELWQRQVIRGQGRAAYDFSHDGIRAVAYDDIGPVGRRAIHLRVAQALEAFHADDLDALSGQIAAHYEQAGQTQAAIKFYRWAAAAAQRIYANADAARIYLHLVEGDLRTSLSPREKCEITLALAEVWRVNGQWVRAQTISLKALAEAEAVGDALVVAQAQRALADVLRLLGYYDAALERLATAEEGFKAVGEWRGVVSALWTMGQIYGARGHYPQALAVLERQLRIATEIGDPRGMAEALETLGMTHWSQGDWERSAECCLQSIAIAEPIAYKFILSRAAITLGNIRSSQHWFGEAVHWYLRAGVLAREIDDRQAVSWAISNIALVLAKRGDALRAITGYERSLRNAWEIGDRWTACLNVAGLAAASERLGQTDLAESLYRKAIGFGLQLGIPGYLCGMLVGLARLLLEQGRAAEAHIFYNEAQIKIASVAGERLVGEDTRFDAQVLGVRLRRALGETTKVEAAAEILAWLPQTASLQRQAALNYELWRLTQDHEAAQDFGELSRAAAAAAFYQVDYAETGAEESRSRYQALTGEALPAPPLLPDLSELIPDEAVDLAGLAVRLAPLLTELAASFE